MVEAARPGFHLVDASIVNGAPLPEEVGRGRSAEGERALALAAVRVARPILDRLDRVERARIAALVACVADPEARVGDALARLAVGGLSLASSLPLHVSGSSACAVFTAMHVARAVLRGAAGARVLLISLDGACAGAVLLGDEGPTVCRPLPPVSVELTAQGGPHEIYGAGLAQALIRGGVEARTIDRVASTGTAIGEPEHVLRCAGLGHALAASPGAHRAAAPSSEEVMARAALRPPEGRTLLWSRDRGGRIGACLLEPA